MQKVSSMVSSRIGDTLANIKNWGDLFYNAGDYGIYPDGTDMTAKLQVLVNNAVLAGRGTIVFPIGEYVVTSITNDSTISYFGDGATFTGGYGRTINSLTNLLTITDQLNSMAYNVRNYGLGNDSASIQEALNQAKLAGGGNVYVPNGYYYINAPMKIASNTTLIMGSNAILHCNANIDVMLINDSDGVTGGYGANKNIKVIGGIFDGNSGLAASTTSLAFGHCTNVQVIGVTFKNTVVWHSIECNGSKDVIIDGCTFEDYVGAGTEYLQIDVNTSTSFPWFGPWDNTPCENVTVQNCIFRNGIDGIGTHTAIETFIHKNIRILNNKFYNMSSYCIRSYNYSRVIIDGNIFENCFQGLAATAMGADVLRDYKIVNNIMYDMKFSNADSTGMAINANINDGIIANNSIRDCGKHGIFIQGNNWLIEGNIITANGVNGLYFFTSTEALIKGNKLIGNNLKSAAGATDMQLLNSAGVIGQNHLVSGNRIGLCTLQYTNNAVFTGNIVTTSVTTTTGNTNLQVIYNRIAGVWA